MNEFSVLDIFIMIAATYTVWVVFFFIMLYKFDFIGLIMGIILPPFIGIFIFPIQTFTALASFTYLAIIIFGLLQLYLLFFEKKYPRNIDNIQLEIVALSREDLDTYRESKDLLWELSRTLYDLKSLNLTKRKDGYYSEKSQIGKEMNIQRQTSEKYISSLKEQIEDSSQKQTNYLYKWIDIQTIRNYAQSLLFAFLVAQLILFITYWIYEPIFIGVLKQLVAKYSQIKILTIFNNQNSYIFEIGGLISLLLYPFALSIINHFKSPYGKEYDKLKNLFKSINGSNISEDDLKYTEN